MKPADPQGRPFRRCAIAGGSGAVGEMFAELLSCSGVEVTVIDRRPPGASTETRRFVCGDICSPSDQVLNELRNADLVMLAVPERAALAAVPHVASVLGPGTLLAHTLSVQSRAAAALRAHALRLEAIGLNPMFSPSLGIVGRPVAAIVVNDGPRAAEFLRVVASWGGRVIPMDAARHDRLAAATQALTHGAVLAFGFALAQMEADIKELEAIAPPPYLTMLALLARIASGTPEVYWDVQTGNPHAQSALKALRSGVLQLTQMTASGSDATFAQVLGQVGDLLGAEYGVYRDVCARMFDRLPSHLSMARSESECDPGWLDLSARPDPGP